MIISADSRPDDAGKGMALSALPDSAGVDFFTPKLDEPAAPRGLSARLLDYSAHAAMIVGLLGFAWTVGDHVVHRPAATDAPVTIVATAPAPTADPLVELRSRNRELADTVHALQARLDTLQASVGDQGKVAAQVRVLQAGLDNVKSTLGTAHSEQAAALARLDGRIDKVAQQPTSKIQGLVDRLGKLEHGTADMSPTASLPRAEAKVADKLPVKIADRGDEPKPVDFRPVPRPVDLKTADAKPAGEEPVKAQVISNWVVRDVYQGVALIEGRRGTLEVVPGVGIPGAGVVKSIDRHGGGWTVTTTKGVVAYAAPPREYRRADRGSFYPGDRYRYDF